MKYLSVLVFAILLSTTWYIINSEASIPIETHAGIQAKMAAMIEEAIKAKKPEATDVTVDNVWTEPFGTENPPKVKAHFTYRYHEPSKEGGLIENVLKGEGLLQKLENDDSGLEKWTLSNIKTTNDAVIFEQALTITTGGSTSGTEPTENMDSNVDSNTNSKIDDK